MNSIVKNILAILAGIVVGMIVNMGLIMLGGALLPIPDGVNAMDANEWGLQQFIFPFLAHALGTLSGALVTAKFAQSYQMIFAICIGVFFLAGGVTMVFVIPAPEWFIFVDLTFAYIPMGLLGAKIVERF